MTSQHRDLVAQARGRGEQVPDDLDPEVARANPRRAIKDGPVTHVADEDILETTVENVSGEGQILAADFFQVVPCAAAIARVSLALVSVGCD